MIMFIDDDDLASPELLEIQLKKCTNPEKWPMTVVQTAIYVIYDKPTLEDQFEVKSYEDEISKFDSWDCPLKWIHVKTDHSCSIYGFPLVVEVMDSLREKIFPKLDGEVHLLCFGDILFRTVCEQRADPESTFLANTHLSQIYPLGICRIWGSFFSQT